MWLSIVHESYEKSLKIQTLHIYAFAYIYIYKQPHKCSKAVMFMLNVGMYFCISCTAIPVFPKHAFHSKSQSKNVRPYLQNQGLIS